MIYSRSDLKQYVKSDQGAYLPPIAMRFKLAWLWLKGCESLPIRKTLYALRQYEYYLNNSQNLSVPGKCLKQYWRFVFRHCQLRYSLYIEPNTIKGGVKIVHPGFRKIPPFVEIGENCTILPMVLIGKKKPGIAGRTVIGKNCYISTGVTILSPIRIGDNVTIGAGAVVTHDIPSNATVAGVPAKILKAP